MSQAAAMHGTGAEPVEYSLTDTLGKLGMWMFLAGDAMGFGALIVGYGALRYYSTNWPQPIRRSWDPSDRLNDLYPDREQRHDGQSPVGYSSW